MSQSGIFVWGFYVVCVCENVCGGCFGGFMVLMGETVDTIVKAASARCEWIGLSRTPTTRDDDDARRRREARARRRRRATVEVCVTRARAIGRSIDRSVVVEMDVERLDAAVRDAFGTAATARASDGGALEALEALKRESGCWKLCLEAYGSARASGRLSFGVCRR